MPRHRLLPLLLILAACVPTPPTPAPSSGKADFADLCAPCHGRGATGDGDLGKSLAHRPADLTGLSQRHGGVFPMAYVMSKIWGYSHGAAPDALMPKFAPLMVGPKVLVDTGDGIQTPTPQRLVEIAAYLTTLQR
ncbi:MAG: cytochrome C [Pseudomonadota bacterium]